MKVTSCDTAKSSSLVVCNLALCLAEYMLMLEKKIKIKLWTDFQLGGMEAVVKK